jgi:predicted nucleic acid-binding Zn ribbon protein
VQRGFGGSVSVCLHRTIYVDFNKIFAYINTMTVNNKNKSKVYTCKNCGKEFHAQADRTTFCSRSCNFEYKKAVSWKCAVCGKDLGVYAHKKFCSDECKATAHELRKVLKTCSHCGKEYKGDKQSMYCSDSCRYLRSYKRSKDYMCKTVKGVCVKCGKEFVNGFGEKRRKYCSDECRNKLKKKDRLSKKIYNHKRKAKKKLLEHSLTKRQWKQALIYFNNKCAYCGREHDLPLHQDHFKPISKGGEYTINNIVPACFDCNVDKSDKDFFEWYSTYTYRSELLKKRILKYLNMNEGCKTQQLAMAL